MTNKVIGDASRFLKQKHDKRSSWNNINLKCFI